MPDGNTTCVIDGKPLTLQYMRTSSTGGDVVTGTLLDTPAVKFRFLVRTDNKVEQSDSFAPTTLPTATVVAILEAIRTDEHSEEPFF